MSDAENTVQLLQKEVDKLEGPFVYACSYYLNATLLVKRKRHLVSNANVVRHEQSI